MGKFAEMVPERVRALTCYLPGKPIQQAEAESGLKMIKLGSNENPFGPSPTRNPGHGGRSTLRPSISGQRHDSATRASCRASRHLAQPVNCYRRFHQPVRHSRTHAACSRTQCGDQRALLYRLSQSSPARRVRSCARFRAATTASISTPSPTPSTRKRGSSSSPIPTIPRGP